MAPNSRRLHPTSSRTLLCALCVCLVLGLTLSGTEVRARSPPSWSFLKEIADEQTRSCSSVWPAAPVERVLVHVCIPTVARPGGVEYLSSTLDSLAYQLDLAGNKPAWLDGVTVYNMHVPAEEHVTPQRYFESKRSRRAWLRVRIRNEPVREHRVMTHGDGIRRVVWRSKEAQDYELTLQMCMAENPHVTYFAVVQDDVEFNEGIRDLASWVAQRYSRPAAVCSLSLYDEDSATPPNGELRADNMVARVWERSRAADFANYIYERYDVDPVDWLARSFCKRKRKPTRVMVPNPLSHRGEISTLQGKVWSL
ncbi:hypothetical protein FVE85_4054 [Porphyridium purpureum]|uniref:Uncharacterized protein n=1 Tax=Porphyridium purpureum TaxID=35688 RepID=A0A5J4YRG9_PORPP|nr:hypothetical protein FVE85_4054 [Porphyridium purpureum]|eukprot:POR3348..scf229_5